MTDSDGLLRVARDARGVVTLTLNDPSRFNALGSEMLTALQQALDAVARDDGARVVVLAWAVMLAWSKPWLDRFRYGPLEWLWRSLTYRTVFPLRK